MTLSGFCHSFILLLSLGVAVPSAAAEASVADNPDFQFALLKYTGGNFNPRPHGLTRLAWEIRRRTSIGMELTVAQVDATDDALFDFPLLVWQGDSGFPLLSDLAIAKLRQHLTMGGTLLVDLSDATPKGAFHQAVLRELGRIFPDKRPTRVPMEHVLYKSYYLVDRHGGRVPAQPFLEGFWLEDRLTVVIIANDLAGAMSRDDFGQWEYDVGAGGDVAREMSFRLGVNLVMYALCLDYKDDQVHLPYILKRRR